MAMGISILKTAIKTAPDPYSGPTQNSFAPIFLNAIRNVFQYPERCAISFP
jgi:hypothetical protein